MYSSINTEDYDDECLESRIVLYSLICFIGGTIFGTILGALFL